MYSTRWFHSSKFELVEWGRKRGTDAIRVQRIALMMWLEMTLLCSPLR